MACTLHQTEHAAQSWDFINGSLDCTNEPWVRLRLRAGVRARVRAKVKAGVRARFRISFQVRNEPWSDLAGLDNHRAAREKGRDGVYHGKE